MTTLQNEAPASKFYIKTFGCQMNVADSERMTALLADQGMEPTEDPREAAVILINGCTVREKAVHKAISTLGTYQDLKGDNGKGPIIGVGGCVGQLDKATLFKRAPYLDFVFGTDTIDNLPEIVHRVRGGERHVVYADFDKSMDYSTETKIHGAKAQAFVNIMKGCDKYCTYCIVPYTRGKEKSRKIDEVVDDVARLVAQGVREVTLLGQNVNSFGKGNANERKREPQELHNVIGKVGPRAGEENFPQLLRAIDQDPRCAGLKRIRFTSSHPLDFSDELISCYAPAERGGVSRLASHLHLPVQSGSNTVLQKMGRHHKIEGYVAQMDALRELCPDVGLSTDLIVGFPTETEEDFQQTLALLDRVRYDNIFAFAYSPRPGTRASKMQDDVPDEVKNERLNRLLKYQLKIAEKTYASRIGKTMEVLVEGESKNQNILSRGVSATAQTRIWSGRTTCNRVVNFASDSPRSFVGRFVEVKITGNTALSLQGELVTEEDPGFAEAQGGSRVILPHHGRWPQIHETAFVAPSADLIGEVEIGEHSSVWFQVVIRGDVNSIRIGKRTNVQDHSLLHVTRPKQADENGKGSALVIGDEVTIGHRVSLHGCTIGNRVLIGMGATVMDDAVVGDDCIIGAGALITRGVRIPPGSLVMGMPAKIARALNPEEIAFLPRSAANYVRDGVEYRGMVPGPTRLGRNDADLTQEEIFDELEGEGE